MKVIDNRNTNRCIALSDLTQGDLFEIKISKNYENKVCLKTASRKIIDTALCIECVCVEDGEVYYFCDWEKVIPLKGSLIIKGEE